MMSVFPRRLEQACLMDYLLFFLLWNSFLSWTAAATKTDYNYYDLIRQDEANARVEFAPSNTSTSNVAKVTYNNETIRLVNLATFLPFNNGSDIYVLAEGAALLLAVHLWNQRDFNATFFHCAEPECRDGSGEKCTSDQRPELVERMGKCNVRFTMDFYDTQLDEVTSAASLGTVLERPKGNIQVPRPAVIFGAHRSSITSPLTILAGIEDIAQISGASTSSYLDDQEVYPLFARTCPSSDGEASAIVDYYVNLGVSRVAILYISDAFGSALQRNFEELASAFRMDTVYAGYVGKEDIPSAIQQIKQSKYQHVFCVAFQSVYNTILEEAYNAGIANGNHAWLFYGPVEYKIQDEAEFKKGSPLYEANKGVAIINFDSVPQTTIQYPGRRRPDPLPKNITTANEQFRFRWQDLHKDQAFFDHVKFKMPDSVILPNDTSKLFPDPVSVFTHFIYDSLTAMAIAMCSTDQEFFTGQDLIDQFASIRFEGNSGCVEFNQVNTRKHTTVRFTVWNLLPAGDNETTMDENNEELHRFLLVPTSMYSSGQWQEIRPFVYADGRTVPPDDLIPVESSTDDVNDSIRYIGLALSISMMLVLVYCMIWTAWIGRDEAVVQASQPSFLLLIAFGSLVQAASILLMSVKHTKTAQDEADKFEIACMAVPWIFYMGLSFTCAALYCKTYRIYEIHRIPDLDRLLIENKDIILFASLIVGMNAFILVLWTVLSPLRYEIVPDGSTDVFGRSLSSYGVCKSHDQNEPNPFWLAILLANVSTLLVANWFSYRTRGIETEYQESQFIAFALGTIIESLVIGNAMQHATRDTPDAHYVITIGSVFLTSFVVAALIFVPKMIAFRAERREKKKKNTDVMARSKNRLSIREKSLAADDGPENEGDSDNGGDPQASSEFYGPGDETSRTWGRSSLGTTGIKILHHPASNDSLNMNQFGSDRRTDSRRGRQNFQQSHYNSAPALEAAPVQPEPPSDAAVISLGTNEVRSHHLTQTTDTQTGEENVCASE